ncbi:MAG: DUF507 family protein [Thermodesulfobacteriota bacterium]
MDKVEEMASLVLKGLKEKKLITLKADEEKILTRMREAILADLKAEDDLDREVEGILNAHAGEIDDERVDYRKMFRMLKNKLVKERGIII